MDAGAIGSIVGAYPLEVLPAEDDLIKGTVNFLINNCFFRGGFFQHITHSGINVYLILQIAQLLLMESDPRYLDIINAMAVLGSETGQWPEAIHPRTLGGCMGDGQHGWASSEWLMIMRSLFVQERGNTLVVGAGILEEWIDKFGEISFGPTLTRFGRISVYFRREGHRVRVLWDADWHKEPDLIYAQIFGMKPCGVSPSSGQAELETPK